jgi:hypothetical protein
MDRALALAAAGWIGALCAAAGHDLRSSDLGAPAAITVGVAPAGESKAKRAPGHAVLRIERGDGITAPHLAELQRRSSTARDLLDRVTRLRSTVLIVRAYPLLVRTTGLYGRGRFWVDGDRLFGYLQYQTESLTNDRPLCVLVHELAHAVEVAGVDRHSGTAGIRDFVLSRAIDDDPLDWRGSETEFPRTVTHQVWLELLGRARGPSALDTLAAAHGVSIPPAQLAQAPETPPRRNQRPPS